MITAGIVHASMDIEQCFDIRRSVFCGLLHQPSDQVFDSWDQDAIHALAQVGNKPVGSGRIARRQGEWWIELVAVLPAFRNRGAGRLMVDALVAEAARQGIDELRVEADPAYGEFLKKMNYQNGVIPVPLDK